MSIEKLNAVGEGALRMAPRQRAGEENLEAGVLQLSKGTGVVVDLRGVGEGKLGDAGTSFV